MYTHTKTNFTLENKLKVCYNTLMKDYNTENKRIKKWKLLYAFIDTDKTAKHSAHVNFVHHKKYQ